MSFDLSRHFVVATFVCAVAGCGSQQRADAQRASQHPPQGQVWLSPDELKKARIDLEPVSERDVEQTISASGRVAFDDERVTHVFSPVTGRLTRIQAKLGQRVKRGDALAILRSPDVGQASSDLGKAAADLLAAEHDFLRKRELLAVHAAAEAEVEAAEDTFRRAKAEKERAAQKRMLLRGGSVEEVTQSYTLVSPIDGEVVARTVSPGAEIQGQYGGGTAAELFTVGELDRVWVLSDVYEMDLHRVEVGAPVSVTTVAYPDRVFEGRVDWIAQTVDPATRTVKVRCTFVNADRALRPEMFVSMRLTTGARKALAIPRSALLRLGSEAVVFVDAGPAPDGRLRLVPRPVPLNDGLSDAWLPVPPDLAAGTLVVASNAIMVAGML